MASATWIATFLPNKKKNNGDPYAFKYNNDRPHSPDGTPFQPRVARTKKGWFAKILSICVDDDVVVAAPKRRQPASGGNNAGFSPFDGVDQCGSPPIIYGQSPQGSPAFARLYTQMPPPSGPFSSPAGAAVPQGLPPPVGGGELLGFSPMHAAVHQQQGQPVAPVAPGQQVVAHLPPNERMTKKELKKLLPQRIPRPDAHLQSEFSPINHESQRFPFTGLDDLPPDAAAVLEAQSRANSPSPGPFLLLPPPAASPGPGLSPTSRAHSASPPHTQPPIGAGGLILPSLANSAYPSCPPTPPPEIWRPASADASSESPPPFWAVGSSSDSQSPSPPPQVWRPRGSSRPSTPPLWGPSSPVGSSPSPPVSPRQWGPESPRAHRPHPHHEDLHPPMAEVHPYGDPRHPMEDPHEIYFHPEIYVDEFGPGPGPPIVVYPF